MEFSWVELPQVDWVISKTIEAVVDVDARAASTAATVGKIRKREKGCCLHNANTLQRVEREKDRLKSRGFHRDFGDAIKIKLGSAANGTNLLCRKFPSRRGSLDQVLSRRRVGVAYYGLMALIITPCGYWLNQTSPSPIIAP